MVTRQVDLSGGRRSEARVVQVRGYRVAIQGTGIPVVQSVEGNLKPLSRVYLQYQFGSLLAGRRLDYIPPGLATGIDMYPAASTASRRFGASRLKCDAWRHLGILLPDGAGGEELSEAAALVAAPPCTRF